MKTKSILLSLFALSLIFISCKKDNVTPSDHVTTVSKSITGYNQIDVSDAFRVYVTFSNSIESIMIEANANLQQYIICKKQNNQLLIYLANNTNIRGNAVLNVYITTKDLNAFYASGATYIQLQNELYSNNVTVNLSGASTFNGSVDLNQLNSQLSGASNLILEGNTGSFNIEASGASNMTSYDFETNYLLANLSGASNVHLTVHQKLDVTASGASNLYYIGDGVIGVQNLSGASQIIKMD